MFMFMGMIMSMVFFVMMPMWPMTDQSPNEEANSCENKHCTHNMTLLGFNLMLKLQANQGNEPSKNERSDHVSK
jgi:hypothetical protein